MMYSDLQRLKASYLGHLSENLLKDRPPPPPKHPVSRYHFTFAVNFLDCGHLSRISLLL